VIGVIASDNSHSRTFGEASLCYSTINRGISTRLNVTRGMSLNNEDSQPGFGIAVNSTWKKMAFWRPVADFSRVSIPTREEEVGRCNALMLGTRRAARSFGMVDNITCFVRPTH
jgi:hypothetical protein